MDNYGYIDSLEQYYSPDTEIEPEFNPFPYHFISDMKFDDAHRLKYIERFESAGHASVLTLRAIGTLESV